MPSSSHAADIVGTIPERIVLSNEAFDHLESALQEAPKEPNPELVKLFSRPKRWRETKGTAPCQK